MPRAKIKKSISHILRFAIAAAALYMAFRKEDLRQVGHDLMVPSFWAIAGAMGLYIVSQLIFVSRWYLLLRVQSIKIGYWPAVRLHFLGLFYNNCLPGSVGGDFLRAWYVTKHTEKKLEAALSVFVDRAVGLFGIFVMAFVGYWFIPAEAKKELFSLSFSLNPLPWLIEYKWIFAVVAGVFVVCIAAFISNQKGRSLFFRACAIVREHGVALLFKTYMAIRIYLHKVPALFAALLLTFLCQGVAIVGMWLIGREINSSIQFKYYLIFFPGSWLLGALPISVGGTGVMEWWLKVMFVKVCMVSGEQAGALALWQRIIWLIWSLPGAVVHLTGFHLPKDFFVDRNRSIH
ncbi:MAG: lysylphosphatidylglycerol synthase transmembrane domain-containing protein [Phycisphaerae bacterium]|nr:lysylphosphatidylglycerol synthase transmembrane domain-containing protein [Phycisphaerae bacterium]